MAQYFGDDNDVFAKATVEPTLDVSSRAFDPRKFIRSTLAAVSHETLDGELVDEVAAMDRETGEALKQIIRDNLGVFISAKSAMDAVFTQDRALFTGEALDAITDVFEDAEAGCQRLVDPLMEAYLDLQRGRQSQSILEKLFAVISVPGTIYELCGVRVAMRKAALAEQAARAAARGSGGGEDANSEEEQEEGEEDEEEDEEEMDEREGGGSRTSSAPKRSASVLVGGRDGAGEDGGGGRRALGELLHAKPADLYVLEPGEEVFMCNGVALVRLRDRKAQRLRVESSANYEAAVLHLRRAMLFLEEHYNLEDGTVIGMVEDDDDDNNNNNNNEKDKEQAGRDGGGDGGGGGGSGGPAHSAVAKTPFMFRYAVALLRASLYLEAQLGEELVHANPADTVLVEDTLSMMMDACIASVKLRHFSLVLRAALGTTEKERALEDLRNRLGNVGNVSVAAADGSPTAPGGPSTAAAMGSSFAGNNNNNNNASFASTPGGGASRTTSAPAAVAPAARRAPATKHPVQFLMAAVRQQHRRQLRARAGDLRREAADWLRKVSQTAEIEQRQRQQLGQAAKGTGKADRPAAAGLPNASLQFGGGMLGNTADSFVMQGGFTVSSMFDKPGSPTRGGDRAPRRSDSTASFESTFSGGGGDARNANSNSGTSSNNKKGRDEEDEKDADADAAMSSFELQEKVKKRILESFGTPELDFGTQTTAVVEGEDLEGVLEGSCVQVQMHARAMLQQLSDRADTEEAVMAQGPLLRSFAARAVEVCVGSLEHVLASYWGGIAGAIHAGVFDFAADAASPLGRMLDAAVRGDGGGAGAGAGAGGPGANTPGGTAALSMATSFASPSMAASFSSPPGVGGAAATGSPSSSTARRAAGAAASSPAAADSAEGAAGVDAVPPLRYLPVMVAPPPSPGEEEEGGAAAAAATTLRVLSIRMIRGMIRSAAAAVKELFLTFVNRGVVSGFVEAMCRYEAGDVAGGGEAAELHAAVLVEVLLAQWERAMTAVSDAVLRLKIVIGESCSTVSVTQEAHVREVQQLLADLEEMRSDAFRCFTHGAGMLAKAYIHTFLATMPPPPPGVSAVAASADNSLEMRLRARLSRDYVSSCLPNKLLNTLSVVLDRALPFLQRAPEVYDSADLFSANAEAAAPPPPDPAEAEAAAAAAAAEKAAGQPRRLRVVRRKRGGPEDTAAQQQAQQQAAQQAAQQQAEPQADPVTQYIAGANSALVVEHLAAHEELLEALVSNALLSFTDMVVTSCLSAGGDDDDDGAYGFDAVEREERIVECMADALSLPTAVAPLLVDELLVPCVFEQTVRLTPSAATPHERFTLLQRKRAEFEEVYLPPVREHCMLAVDAMLATFLAIPQQRITREVCGAGFMAPRFDWQRTSRYLAAAVRPYVGNSVVAIAQAHERLNWIRQPVLGAAATQRLAAHMAGCFMSALSGDLNAHELSPDCSLDYALHGSLMVEAEGLTVAALAAAIMDGVRRSPVAGGVLPELALAHSSLEAFVGCLARHNEQVCAALAQSRPAALAQAGGGEGLHLPKVRAARRQEMVAAATRDLQYMIDAVSTHLADEVPAGAVGDGAAGGAAATSEVAQGIAARMAKRRPGYDLRHQPQAPPPKQQQQQQRRARAGSAYAAGRRPPAGTPPEPKSPRSPGLDVGARAQAATALLRSAMEDSAAQPQQQQQQPSSTRQRRTKRVARQQRRGAAEAAAAQQQEEEQPAVMAPLTARGTEPQEVPQPPPSRRAPRRTAGAPGTEGEGAARPLRQRRANRFHRENAL